MAGSVTRPRPVVGLQPTHGATRSRIRRLPWARSALAALSGLLLMTAFPPLGWWPAAIVAVTGFSFATRGARARTGALVGWVFAVALFVPLLTWLRPIGDDAWLGLSVVEALYFAGLGAAGAVVSRLPLWPLWTACLWVTEEFVRGRVPFGGFTWGRLSFVQPDGPLVPWVAVGGAALLTFATALAGTLLAALVLHARRRRVVAAGCAAGMAAVAAGGLLVPVPTGGQTAGGPAYARVAVIQGNVPRLGLAELTQAAAVLRNHVETTERYAAEVAAGRTPRPDIVVWPENASDFDPFADPAVRQVIDAAVRAVGVPTLIGAMLDGPGPHHVRNTGIAWSPTTGPGEIYVKRHPVPFGEYIPLRGVLGHLIGRFQLIPADMVKGTRPGLMHLGNVRIGDIICFEVAYDDIVRDAVTAGGRLLVVQTNNATFERRGDSGRSGETAQQLAMARLRAVEHGRAVLVAATSGVSAIVAPDGTVRERSGVFSSAVLTARVPLRDSLTLADRVGAAPEWALALIGALAVAAAVVRRRLA